MKQSIDIELLKWDSELFNYKVGKINFDKYFIIDLNSLAKCEFYLIYIFSQFKLDLKIFEDTKITFYQVLDKNDYDSDTLNNIEIFNHDDFTKLILLAFESGNYSRFKRDGNFKNFEFEKLYFNWILRSVNKEIADIVYVYKENGDILGFVSLALKDDFCEIGLISVDNKVRGKGIGKLLISAAKYFTYINGRKEIRVATQEINLAAMNFYFKNGFKILNKTYIYHYWNIK